MAIGEEAYYFQDLNSCLYKFISGSWGVKKGNHQISRKGPLDLGYMDSLEEKNTTLPQGLTTKKNDKFDQIETIWVIFSL